MAFDTIQVTVNAAPNVPPSANAGVDQVNSVTNKYGYIEW